LRRAIDLRWIRRQDMASDDDRRADPVVRDAIAVRGAIAVS
jgi:hypothetical protein